MKLMLIAQSTGNQLQFPSAGCLLNRHSGAI